MQVWTLKCYSKNSKSMGDITFLGFSSNPKSWEIKMLKGIFKCQKQDKNTGEMENVKLSSTVYLP